MRTPFAWLADRFALERRSLRWSTTAALVASVMIIVTGSLVRVTGSGLGCDTWPNCTAGNLAPTAEMGIHGVIEFGNRLLTIVLCAAVGWVIIAARLQRNSVPGIRWWAWAQFAVILLNAVVGGVTVWIRLSPYVVAAHFLAAMLLLTMTTVTWHKVRLLDTPPSQEVERAPVPRWGTALMVSTALLIVLGTLVTGTGPHAGDSADIPRMGFDWHVVTWLHTGIATAVGAIAIGLWVNSCAQWSPRVTRRIKAFLMVFAAQGIIGLVQVANGLPEVVVVLHLLGSALVWIGALRVYLDTRPSSRQLTTTPPYDGTVPSAP